MTFRPKKPLSPIKPKSSMPKKDEDIKIVKVGRNEPCSCGSGKKYKKCCLITLNHYANTDTRSTDYVKMLMELQTELNLRLPYTTIWRNFSKISE